MGILTTEDVHNITWNNVASGSCSLSYDKYYKDAQIRELKEENRYLEHKLDNIKKRLVESLEPEKIIRNNRATIVIWGDGKKTIVKCEEGKTYDVYEAYTAALAKRIYGTNSALKRLIISKYVEQSSDDKSVNIEIKVPFTKNAKRLKKQLDDIKESIKRI